MYVCKLYNNFVLPRQVGRQVLGTKISIDILLTQVFCKSVPLRFLSFKFTFVSRFSFLDIICGFEIETVHVIIFYIKLGRQDYAIYQERKNKIASLKQVVFFLPKKKKFFFYEKIFFSTFYIIYKMLPEGKMKVYYPRVGIKFPGAFKSILFYGKKLGGVLNPSLVSRKFLYRKW